MLTERVTLDLAEAIRAVLTGHRPPASDKQPPVGYWIPRQNVILGQWIRHAGWYPDYQLRLFRRSCGRYDPTVRCMSWCSLPGRPGNSPPRWST